MSAIAVDVPQLDPEIKAEWIARLRSGKYEQGRSYLKRVDPIDPPKHCCLGVLGEMAVAAGKASWEVRYESTHGQGAEVPDNQLALVGRCGESHNSGQQLLPTTVIGWAVVRGYDLYMDRAAVERAFPGRLSVPLPGALRIALDSLNDSGFTFAEIADLIEEQL